MRKWTSPFGSRLGRPSCSTTFIVDSFTGPLAVWIVRPSSSPMNSISVDAFAVTSFSGASTVNVGVVVADRVDRAEVRARRDRGEVGRTSEQRGRARGTARPTVRPTP